MIFQSTIDNDISDPWNGICCEACWNASGERCQCRCGGTYHGAGNPNKQENKISRKPLYPIYPSAQLYKKLISDPHCHCGFDLSKEPVQAHDHSDGWEVKEVEPFQWLWIACPKCGYDTAIWKMGVSRGTRLRDVE